VHSAEGEMDTFSVPVQAAELKKCFWDLESGRFTAVPSGCHQGYLVLGNVVECLEARMHLEISRSIQHFGSVWDVDEGDDLAPMNSSSGQQCRQLPACHPFL